MKKPILLAILLLVLVQITTLFLLQQRRSAPLVLPDCTTAQCWQEAVTGALKSHGVDGALSMLAAAYDRDPSFSDTCHDLTHYIGKEAYGMFVKKRDFRVTPKTAYCSYGFYHGFMETLVSRQGDMQLAREFCQYVDRQITKESPDAVYQCFHGIGHGTVNNHNEATWGNEQAMIDPALALCEQVAVSAEERSRCATGVYNGLAVFYNGGEYNLKVDPADPLRICRTQKEEYKDACYISLNVTVLAVTGGDFAAGAKFIEAIPEDTYAQHAIINLAAPVGSRNMNVDDHADILAICRSLQPRLRQACIQGYAYGFLEQGLPEQEYKQPIAFCGEADLTESERTACYDYIFSYLKQWYSAEKNQQICSSVPAAVQELCRKRSTGDRS